MAEKQSKILHGLNKIRETKRRFMSGELFEPVHRQVDMMQAQLGHKDLFDEISKPLGDDELSLLEKTTDFGLHTHRGLYELAEKAGEGLSDQALALSLDSLLLRKRMQRRGVECDIFGIGGSMYLLQSLSPVLGAFAYWFTSRVYLRTISKGAFKARKETGKADKEMVNFLIDLLVDPEHTISKFIDLKNISITSGDLVESGSFSRYIKEWWGLGPAIAISASSILAENFITPAISFLVLGLYQLFGKKELKNDEIEQMVRASEKKVDIQGTGLVTSIFSKTIGASILAAVTIAQTDVTARQFFAMKPEHDRNYQKVNMLIANSIRAVRSGVIINSENTTLATDFIADLQPIFQQWFGSLGKTDKAFFKLSDIEEPSELLDQSLALLKTNKYLNMLDDDDVGHLSTIESMRAFVSYKDQSKQQQEATIARSLILVILIFSKIRSKLESNNMNDHFF